MASLPYNLIISFKDQEKTQDNKMDNLADDNFILCIQTEFQHDMLQKFGKDIISIDSTHCTNMYDFNLIIIIVIDGERIPVARMSASIVRCNGNNSFFTALKETCDIISSK